jgi:hypothetical protein
LKPTKTLAIKIAENKGFEKGFQSTGTLIGLPLGAIVTATKISKSLPLIGNAGENLPTGFYQAIAAIGGTAGICANYCGNFGAAIDVIVRLTIGDKKLRELSAQEIGLMFGATIGTGITIYLFPYITAAGTEYPLGEELELIPASFVQTIAIPVVGGSFANWFGHFGKGIDNTLEIAKATYTKMRSTSRETINNPNNNPIEMEAKTQESPPTADTHLHDIETSNIEESPVVRIHW